MTPDTALGVSSELQFALKAGWTIAQDADRFRIKPPADLSSQPNFGRLLREEIWRIAQFVAYDNFVSISKTFDNGYVLNSRMASGEGFEIYFEAN